MKNIFKIFISSFIFFTLLFPFSLNAQILDGNIQGKIEDQRTDFAIGAGVNSVVSIGSVAETVIKGFLALLAIIFIILIIIAGYNWMTAAGDEAKVTYAKDTMKRAIIGLLIIVASYAITVFIFQNISFGPTGPPPGPT